MRQKQADLMERIAEALYLADRRWQKQPTSRAALEANYLRRFAQQGYWRAQARAAIAAQPTPGRASLRVEVI